MEKKIQIGAVDNFSDVLNGIKDTQKGFYDSYMANIEKSMAATKAERDARAKIFEEQKAQIENITKTKLASLEQEKAAARQSISSAKMEALKQNEYYYNQDTKAAKEKLKGKELKKELSNIQSEYDKASKKTEAKYKDQESKVNSKFKEQEKQYYKDKVNNLKDLEKEQDKVNKGIEKGYKLQEKDEKIEKQNRLRSLGETGINASISELGKAASTGNAYGAMINAGGAIGSSAASMIPGVGGILGTAVSAVADVFSAALAASKATEDSRIMSRNLTGGGFGSLSFMTEAESGSLFLSAAKQRGRKGNTEMATAFEMERKMGFNPNELSGGMNRFETMLGNDQSSASMMKDFLRAASKSKLWGVDKGDFSNVGNVISHGLLPLFQRESELSDKMSGSRAIYTQNTFARLKGGWKDSTIGSQRIQQIDQMIRNPSSQFAQNLISSAILQNNPNASMLNMQDIQAQGIMNMGTFGTTLKMIKGLSPETQHLALNSLLPSLAGNPEARNALLNNSDFFTEGATEESIKSGLLARNVDDDVVKKIMANATKGTQGDLQLKIYDELVRMGDALVKTISPYVKKISEFITGENTAPTPDIIKEYLPEEGEFKKGLNRVASIISTPKEIADREKINQNLQVSKATNIEYSNLFTKGSKENRKELSEFEKEGDLQGLSESDLETLVKQFEVQNVTGIKTKGAAGFEKYLKNENSEYPNKEYKEQKDINTQFISLLKQILTQANFNTNNEKTWSSLSKKLNNATKQ